MSEDTLKLPLDNKDKTTLEKLIADDLRDHGENWMPVKITKTTGSHLFFRGCFVTASRADGRFFLYFAATALPGQKPYWLVEKIV